MTVDSTRDVNPARIDVAEWKALADMLADVLREWGGDGHETCEPNGCAVRYVLNLHETYTSR